MTNDTPTDGIADRQVKEAVEAALPVKEELMARGVMLITVPIFGMNPFAQCSAFCLMMCHGVMPYCHSRTVELSIACEPAAMRFPLCLFADDAEGSKASDHVLPEFSVLASPYIDVLPVVLMSCGP